MDPRIQIPGLALLSLSLTECVERDPEALPDPIIGEWHAVMIDGEKYPIVEADGPYMAEYGFDLRVEADLHGVLVLAFEADYDGYVSSQEQGSTIVVDASDAPRYRIDVKRSLFGGYGDDGSPSDPSGIVTLTGLDTGYYGTGYDDTASTDGDPTTTGTTADPTGDDPYGGPELPDTSRPLQIPLTPRLAPAEMVLRCTLDADVLNCKRDGSEKPLTWVFERDEEPAPAP
jgi:hypothetical protein